MSVLPALARAAQEWVGTPFRHQAALKGVGCDCVGLLRGVLREVTGEPLPFIADYARQAPAHWQEPMIEPWLAASCERRGDVGLEPGLVLVFASLDARQVGVHVGIMIHQGRFVHAWSARSKVVETPLVGSFRRQLTSAWAWRGEAASQP